MKPMPGFSDEEEGVDRRDFLVQTGTMLAGATLAPRSLAMVAEDQPGGAQQCRLVLPINRNWRYSPKVADGGHAIAFDDSGFDHVVVPHTNRRLPWHSFDEKLYEFVSLYRRPFKLPAEAKGKRVFVDFEGVMTASTVWINGTKLGEYKGGYTPFTFELTPHIDFAGDNLLAVDVDSTERADIPPFGYQIDYLTFGGIYREVALRIVPQTFIENIFAQPKDVLSSAPTVDVHTYIQQSESPSQPLSLAVEILDGDKVIAQGTQKIPSAQPSAEPAEYTVHLEKLGAIQLWDLKTPKLYQTRVRLLQ